MASGTTTEAKVLAALVDQGLTVLLPFDRDAPYDLVVMLDDDRLLKVQCKTARPAGDCFAFNTCSTDHGHGRQDYRGRAHVFGVHLPLRDQVYVFDVASAPTRAMRVRLSPTRNNQARGVRWAADHTVERWAATVHGPEGTA